MKVQWNKQAKVLEILVGPLAVMFVENMVLRNQNPIERSDKFIMDLPFRIQLVPECELGLLGS